MPGLNRLTPSLGWGARPAPVRPPAGRPQPAGAAAAATRPQRRDPAPSRLSYRLTRMWLTPLYRRVIRIGLPAFLACMIAGLWLSDETRRASLQGGVTAMIEKVQTREAFMVHRMQISGASAAVEKGLLAMLPVTLPASSFDIDLDSLRAQVERLDAVEKVELRIMPGGILSAHVTERRPAVLWRHARGIDLLDKGGYRVASVTSRDVRRDLPMIAGEGAGARAAEAMALIDAAGPVLPRLRGLERMGERRWDLVLDRGQRIMLPAERPVAALEQALAMDREGGLLARDVVAVDLRDPGRPILRLGLTAQNTLRRALGMPELAPDGSVIEPDEGKDGTAGGKAGAAAGKRPADRG